MGKSSKKLKAALQSQQSRFKEKEKASHAAQIAEQRARKLNGRSGTKKADNLKGKGTRTINDKVGKGKAKDVTLRPQRPTIPFQATDTILLIGEGNFSFARALVDPSSSRAEFAHLTHLPPGNVTATAYDSEEECYEKYPESQDIVAKLRERGVDVRFNVDGTKLERVSGFKDRIWSRIVWNFPHAGKGITDQDRNILSNQVLIMGFLRSAAKFLKQGPVPSVMGAGKGKRKSEDDEEDVTSEHEEEGDIDIDAPPEPQSSSRGTILITLRNVAPYTLWDVPRLAKNPPPPQGSTPPNPRYTILRSFVFHREVWDGYEHRMTKGERAHGTGKTGEGGEDRTWEFCLRDR